MSKNFWRSAAALIALYAVAGIAIAMVWPSHAAEKTFTWTAPTTNTDGSALAPAQIAGYTITCTPSRVLTVNGPVTSFKADFGPGDHTCSAVTRATNGQTSAPSNAVSFTVPQPVPNAPAGFSVD